MTTAELALLEQREARRYYRQGHRSFHSRVYDVSTDDTPPMPRAGEYFPGETSGYRIIPGGVSCVPVAGRGTTGLRITITAMLPHCEMFLLHKKTVIDALSPYGYFSPGGTLIEGKPVQYRVDGKFYIFWNTDRWKLVQVGTPANRWERVDAAIAGDYATLQGAATQAVTLKALSAGADETFSQEIG